MSTISKRIVAKMVSNSATAPTTPSRRGLADWAKIPLPTEGGDLIDRRLHIVTPSGGKFFIGRKTPKTPKEEGVEQRDRRLKENRPPKEAAVLFRMLLYGLFVDAGLDIQYIEVPQWLKDQNTPRRGDKLGKLAQSVKLGKLS
jgi:hypothetical protein